MLMISQMMSYLRAKKLSQTYREKNECGKMAITKKSVGDHGKSRSSSSTCLDGGPADPQTTAKLIVCGLVYMYCMHCSVL